MINDDEMNLLKLGTKFCVLGRLDEEKFEVELEHIIMKLKWDMMAREDKDKKKSLSDKAIECAIDEEQLDECEEHEEMLEARTRMIYDIERNKLTLLKVEPQI